VVEVVAGRDGFVVELVGGGFGYAVEMVVELCALVGGGYLGCIASLRASLTPYWCFACKLQRVALQPAFLGWLPVLTTTSQSPVGLWPVPLPLLLLLLLQLPHPIHWSGYDQSPCPLEACVLVMVPTEVIDMEPCSGLAWGGSTVAWLCCGGGGVDWLVEVLFGDVSECWVLRTIDDGGGFWVDDWLGGGGWILAVVFHLGASAGSLSWVACQGHLPAYNMVGAKCWDK
jgi:hypothetical protein